MPETAAKPLILVNGKMNARFAERLAGRADLLHLPDGQPGAIDLVNAGRIAVMADFGHVPAALIDALPALRLIAHFGVGYDGVDVGRAAARGIIVTNTPDVLNDEVADTTIGLLINVIRQLPAAEAWLRAGRWVSDGPFRLSPLSLAGRRAGLYGMGRIGQGIARRLAAFGLPISYHSRRPRTDVPWRHVPTLEALADEVDTLIAIVPKTPETFKTINADILTRLGPQGVLINVGRGWTVDEEALAAALEAGTIAAAGLDVFQDEPHVPEALLKAPNLTLLPHVASGSVPTRNAMADLVADNVIAWLDGRPVLTPVPETPVPGTPATGNAVPLT